MRRRSRVPPSASLVSGCGSEGPAVAVVGANGRFGKGQAAGAPGSSLTRRYTSLQDAMLLGRAV